MRAPRKDAVNRIFVEDTCQGNEAAWAHVLAIEGDGPRCGRGYVTENDIAMCPRILSRPDDIVDTIRHEMGHA